MRQIAVLDDAVTTGDAPWNFFNLVRFAEPNAAPLWFGDGEPGPRPFTNAHPADGIAQILQAFARPARVQ